METREAQENLSELHISAYASAVGRPAFNSSTVSLDRWKTRRIPIDHFCSLLASMEVRQHAGQPKHPS